MRNSTAISRAGTPESMSALIFPATEGLGGLVVVLGVGAPDVGRYDEFDAVLAGVAEPAALSTVLATLTTCGVDR